MEMKAIDKIAYVLVVIGGLNWGIIGIFDRELIYDILGLPSGLSRTIYTVIGLAAAYMVYTMFVMMNKQAKHEK